MTFQAFITALLFYRVEYFYIALLASSFLSFLFILNVVSYDFALYRSGYGSFFDHLQCLLVCIIL